MTARTPLWTLQPAYELIGQEGHFRLPGGRTVYQAVMFNDATARGDRPRLARLEATPEGIRQVNHWVDWDQPIEVLVTDKAYTYKGWTISRGYYQDTTDDRLDRWYICPPGGNKLDHRGPGYPTLNLATEAVLSELADADADADEA